MSGWAVRWMDGSADEPPVQTHGYDDRTVLIRQSKRTSFEAPFLALLLGRDRALLLDTGATEDPRRWPLRATIDRLLADRPPTYELVVAHTHGHGDHVAGDGQLAGRPRTTVVGPALEDVRAHFGLADWPDGVAELDLGDRTISLIPSPGHHRAAVTYYDPSSRILFTGDTILQGRLFVSDAAAYRATVDRLIDFCGRYPVDWLLGCHVEMTSDGREYALGRIHQPDEAPPQMPVSRLADVRTLVARVHGRRGVHRSGDLVLYHEPRLRDVARLQAGAVWDRLRLVVP